MNLTFTHRDDRPVAVEPVLARDAAPDWFSKLPATCPAQPNEMPVGTVRKCVPFRDALHAGYMLLLPQAIRVVKDDDELHFSWAQSDLGQAAVERHSAIQAGGAYGDVFKFLVGWGVNIPEGYSVLYTHPLNRHDLPFRSLSGVVDDAYTSPVQIPFTWESDQDEALLDRGLPIAQLIPFRREEWEHTTKAIPWPDLLATGTVATTALDGYRRNFHRPKVYR